MGTELLLKYSTVAVIALCIGVFGLMARKNLLREFPLLGALLCVQVIDNGISLAILFFRQSLGIEIHAAYKIYFYGHWASQVVDGTLRILIIYSVFALAMKPLQGLHQIGKVIFRWVAAVSIMVSVAIALGPHVVSPGYGLTVAIASVTGQIEQGIGVLTLCLLLFVCFSTKPLGITYRSRIFGVTMGLGIMATTALIQSAWTSVAAGRSLYSPVHLVGAIGSLAAAMAWATYFALPEPERRMITLPTTSPFFFWNRISEALGDEPGDVVIAGFRPSMLAAAELQMLTAPSTLRTETPVDISLPAMHTAMHTAMLPAAASL